MQIIPDFSCKNFSALAISASVAYNTVKVTPMDMIPYEQRYRVTLRGWTYMLCDIDHTAWVTHGSIHRCRRFRIPSQVTFKGQCYTIESIEMGAFGHCRQLRHLVIPDSIRYIDEDCFCFLPHLQSVYVGSNIESLSSWHFRGCPNLHHISIDVHNRFLKVEDGLLLSRDGKTLWRTMRQKATINIPAGVETIAACALWYSVFSHVTFPRSLRKIEDNACSYLPNLRQLVLPEGVTDLEVQCFCGCSNLQEVDLPATLTHLEPEVFSECDHLRKLILRSNEVVQVAYSEDEAAFYQQCTICVPEQLLNTYRQHPVWGLCSVQPIKMAD